MEKYIKRSFMVLIILLLAAIAGCNNANVNDVRQQIVAEVNDEKILKGEMLDLYNQQKSYYGITDDINKEEEVAVKKDILE